MSQPMIVIPSLEPDQKLIHLLDTIRQQDTQIPILIIDDGSGPDYKYIFQLAETNYNTTNIHLPKNLGKGAALKIAMDHIIKNEPQIDKMVTIDSDGQHSYEDMVKTIQMSDQHPDGLILGTRQFDEKIPFRSKFGNVITRNILKWTTGIEIEDTQTGLRVIPRSFLPVLQTVDGDRFEYETNMLIETKKQGWPIYSQPITTTYIEGNASSHFRIIADSVSIYGVVFKYILSSISSFIVDIVAYTILIYLFNQLDFASILFASIGSRAISSLFNYYVNQKFVFARNTPYSLLKYYTLVIVQICLSAVLVYAVHAVLQSEEVVAVKVIVDTLLFVLSYYVQKNFIFKEVEP
ncbi:MULTISPECIES: bifunctional glycosyltransferase family 2/GtrA family protein [Aerococcus]|uniref:bifunctional glycosyltransferase family 2/GtrA family protein n=1 Tax=Aerococcus TaxID=1375 RepID=UPI0028FD220F|nr:bifunctional glycosyltransferase family 2/GtrA family protein [Aerococcus viridans]MEC1386038.1 bifunctional glycosyltransferase family 2/GtrA family protein [Aerococcus viridans]GMR71142.1 bifunctional glycosyltransferase family 2/GtrA family protein [Aerococcus viridans]